MDKWAHKYVMLPVGLDEAMVVIEKLGLEGWEMIQICPPGINLETGEHICLTWFKKRV
jgi:hypothetical protein